MACSSLVTEFNPSNFVQSQCAGDGPSGSAGRGAWPCTTSLLLPQKTGSGHEAVLYWAEVSPGNHRQVFWRQKTDCQVLWLLQCVSFFLHMPLVQFVSRDCAKWTCIGRRKSSRSSSTATLGKREACALCQTSGSAEGFCVPSPPRRCIVCNWPYACHDKKGCEHRPLHWQHRRLGKDYSSLEFPPSRSSHHRREVSPEQLNDCEFLVSTRPNCMMNINLICTNDRCI